MSKVIFTKIKYLDSFLSAVIIVIYIKFDCITNFIFPNFYLLKYSLLNRILLQVLIILELLFCLHVIYPLLEQYPRKQPGFRLLNSYEAKLLRCVV